MNTHEKTTAAAVVCLVLSVAGLMLFNSAFEWPTSQFGRPPTQNEILTHDVVPIIIAGFAIGLIAIAITRSIFPRSSIKVILGVVGGGAALLSLPLMVLSAAIGAGNIRDTGMVAMLFAVPLAIATWGVISRCLVRPTS